jgi:hypothetical protein
VRSGNGTGLVCAPTVSPRRFAHPSLHQGKEAAAIVAVLEAFSRPALVADVLRRLGAGRLELIDHLAQARFLGQPAKEP